MRDEQPASEEDASLAETVMAAAAAEGIELHSMLVQQKGVVIAEAYAAPFDAETPHRMYSVTKSFTSTAIGLAVAEGRLTVEDRIVDHFPEYVPAGSSGLLNEIRIKHLLTMSSGQVQPQFSPLARPGPTRAGFFAMAPAVAPGSRFDYSNFCSYMLSATVERVTGETLAGYLGPRIFEPLGIASRHWLRSEEGVTNGGWGLHLTTRELARFGQLYLDRGVWDGRPLIPAGWIEEATAKQIDSWNRASMDDWHQGYCYQLWRSRHDSYRMDGLLGQFCLVFPGLDSLVVTTAGTARTQRLLELVWEHVVPVLGGTTPGPRPLQQASPPQRHAQSPRLSELTGTPFRLPETLVLPTRLYGGQAPIVSFAMEREGDALALVATDSNAPYWLSVGALDWARGATPFSTGFLEPYAAMAGWESESRLVVDLVFTEAGFRLSLVFDLDPQQLSLTFPANPGLDARVVIGRPFP